MSFVKYHKRPLVLSGRFFCAMQENSKKSARNFLAVAYQKAYLCRVSCNGQTKTIVSHKKRKYYEQCKDSRRLRCECAVSDTHFVKTAIAFWFDDEDYGSDCKIWEYYN